MPYWQLFYHLVWATKNREHLLVGEIETRAHDLIRGKAIGLGATVFAVNGKEDHVHVAAAIPPSIAIARFVGQVKGSSATVFNKSSRTDSIAWQDDYSAFSFHGSQLPNYIAYVKRQKIHHTEDTIIPILERTGGGLINQLHEEIAFYEVEDPLWRQELVAYEQNVEISLGNR